VTAERRSPEVAAILIAGQRLLMAAAARDYPRNPAFEHGQDDREDNRDVQAIDQELRIRQKLWDERLR
jgi:hypothetical protein